MKTLSLDTFPNPPRARWVEQLGRIVLTTALAALVLALHVILVDEKLRPAWAALSSLFLLGVGQVVALLIQGGRPSGWVLFSVGGVALLFGWLLNGGVLGAPAAGVDLTGMVAVLLAAAMLGTLVARGLRTPGEWLTVILCAAVGDAWFTVLGVMEGVAVGHPLSLMRMSVLSGEGARLAPVFMDFFFMALYLEMGRRLGLRTLLLTFGALAGYAGAEVVSLTTWQSMPALPLMGLGVLAGSWAELRCSPREVLKGLAAALILFSLLLGLIYVRRALHPLPKRKPEFFLPRDVAVLKEGERWAGELHVWGGIFSVELAANSKNDVDGVPGRCTVSVPSGMESYTSRA